ncbi:Uma2 family endonuclease [Hymenobacter sp. ASUV-10]|uniref:Uma2 family endonuclease n=1 Tax=Hymenobacter aranciens TaxID=3063996 RepID=A0ABT9BJV5_9BACT|nr:Uma2 family endonuclease [Hymenobacter sp. ASUV-10]MDO7876926.1 Uma2 family endonuclease [Hymenobacter sp. ASUV-10]
MTVATRRQFDLDRTFSYANMLKWQQLHQVVLSTITNIIRQYLKGSIGQAFVAPFDVRLTTNGGNSDQQITTVVQPDIFVVCDRSKLDDRGCLGAPDWIVEIVSPGNTSRDTKTKFDLYEESGVSEYWIVYPGLKSVAIYVLDNGQYRLSAEYAEPGPVPVATLPGLALEWEEIFAE